MIMLVEIDKTLNAGNHEANLCKIYLYARELRGGNRCEVKS